MPVAVLGRGVDTPVFGAVYLYDEKMPRITVNRQSLGVGRRDKSRSLEQGSREDNGDFGKIPHDWRVPLLEAAQDQRAALLHLLDDLIPVDVASRVVSQRAQRASERGDRYVSANVGKVPEGNLEQGTREKLVDDLQRQQLDRRVFRSHQEYLALIERAQKGCLVLDQAPDRRPL